MQDYSAEFHKPVLDLPVVKPPTLGNPLFHIRPHTHRAIGARVWGGIALIRGPQGMRFHKRFRSVSPRGNMENQFE